MFYVVVKTKSAATVPATQATLEQVNSMLTKAPTPAELQHAKDDLLNSFIFSTTRGRRSSASREILELYHYPADFLERYPGAIQKVTSADVQRVANKYIQPTKLATVVVGNGSEIQPPLTQLGTVTPAGHHRFRRLPARLQARRGRARRNLVPEDRCKGAR